VASTKKFTAGSEHTVSLVAGTVLFKRSIAIS